MKRLIQSKQRIRDLIISKAGFTLIEMVIATTLVSIFFGMVAMIVPTWYQSYNTMVNINYSRQMAGNVMSAIENQIMFADIDEGEDGTAISGTLGIKKFRIPMLDKDDLPTTNLIDGLVYDEKFFMKNDISLNFDLQADEKYCKVTVKVFSKEDGNKTILEKTRAIALVGDK